MSIAMQRAASLVALLLQFAPLPCGAGTINREPGQQMMAQIKSSLPLTDKLRPRPQRATTVAGEPILKEEGIVRRSEKSDKRPKRYCMSQADIYEFLWVEAPLLRWMLERHNNVALARARTEVATARAFGLEPANWAKRDIGIYLDSLRMFEKKRDEVEQRLKAAQKHADDVESEMINKSGNDFNPLKNAMMYWFQDTRNKEPNNPYAIAIQKQRKIEYEREQLYHQFNRETPEERAGGALAILLAGAMLDAAVGEAELGGESAAALKSLGKAETALAAAESQVAMSSIMEARAILISAEEAEAALAAVGKARTALAAGKLQRAAAAVEEAQAALAEELRVNPAAAALLASLGEAEARLDSAEKADIDVGLHEKAMINLYSYAATHPGNLNQVLAADLREATSYRAQYRNRVANGQIIPSKSGDRVMRTGCPYKGKSQATPLTTIMPVEPGRASNAGVTRQSTNAAPVAILPASPPAALTGIWTGTYSWICGGGGSVPIEITLVQEASSRDLRGKVSYRSSTTNLAGLRWEKATVDAQGSIKAGSTGPTGLTVSLEWGATTGFVNNYFVGTLSGDVITGVASNGDSPPSGRAPRGCSGGSGGPAPEASGSFIVQRKP